jgi:hypothetical protein
MRRRSVMTLATLGLAAAFLVPGARGIDDLTPPVVAFNIVGTKGANGWYTSNVTVSWSFSDPESGIKSWSPGCNATTLVSDTPGTVLTCSATNFADVSSSVGVTIRIDKTAPTVTQAAPDRGPDNGDWYTRPVNVTFRGADAISGVEACSAVTYSGPDSISASVSGACRDRAGNVSAQGSFSFHFDATAPSLSQVNVEAASHVATISWRPLPPSELVTIRRSPEPSGPERIVYEGGGGSFTDRSVLNGIRYRYVVIATDHARNSDSEIVEAAPRGPLRAPAEKAQVRTPPVLRWVKVRKVSFYNVQLFRNGRKVLSAWPVRTQLQLKKTWVWNGRRRRLVPGTYRWFVWPAYKRRGAIRYGKSLGYSDFVIPAAK